MEETTHHNEFDLEVFIDIVKKSKFWLIAFAVISFALAFLYVRYTPPIYESTLIMQIHKDNEAGNVLNMYNQMENNDITSELELMRSKLLFKRTIKKLPLDVKYYTEGEVLANDNYKYTSFKIKRYTVIDSYIIGKKIYVEPVGKDKVDLYLENGDKINETPISSGEEFSTPYITGYFYIVNQEAFDNSMASDKLYFVVTDFEAIVNSLYPHLSINVLNNNARTVQIAFKHNNRELAKDIVEQLAKEYDAYSLEKKSSSYNNVVQFIQEQKERVEKRLKESEKAIYNYKRHNEVRGSGQVSGTYVVRLEDLENEILKKEMDLTVLQEMQKKIEEYKGSPDIFGLIPLFMGRGFSQTLQDLVLNLRDKIEEREVLLTKVTGENRNVEILNKQIEMQVALVLEAVKISVEQTKEKLKLLKEKSRALDKTIYSLPEKELELARLDRVLQINSKFYTMLLEKETEYKLSTAGLVTYNEILEQAKVPTVPIAPQKKAIYIIAILATIVLFIGFIVIRYVFHDEITGLNEITRRLPDNVGVLGVVPHYKNKIPVSQLIIHKNPKSLITEAFRALRTNMEFLSNKKGCKTIAVTSTISGEGKTFIALNLAGIIAYSGKKVIVLDLDMRKPKIHMGFGVDNKKGMSTLLVNKDKVEHCINHSELKGLDFITAGPIPPNPSELIINGEIDKIVDYLSKHYDYIMIDNPPVGLVTDGLMMIKKADYPIYVFKANYSKRHFIENVSRIVTDNKIHNLSIILNNIDTQKSTYGKGYGYGYTTYGGYYTDDEKVKNKMSFFKKK